MQRGRPVPGWLIRRRYFQRFGHWVAPRRQGTADVEPTSADAPSNVLRFPSPAGGSREAAATRKANAP